MKSTVQADTEKAVPLYPYFGMWPDGSMIVLFTYPKRGTLVHDSGNPARIGEFREDWAEADFLRWNGSVTISV